ncbi:DUF420 domain-containing protein [Aquimarina rhabdastrellae]
MSKEVAELNKKYNKWVIALSIIIPVAVAALFGIRIPNVERLGFLPPIYATINGLTAVVLVWAVVMIKNGNRVAHERLMKVAILFSVLFLLMYIAYHATSDATKFGDSNHDGILSDIEAANVAGTAMIYYFILISHIILSIAVIPFVLIAYVRTLSEQFDKHKKVAKIAFPIWLYVAVTGVIVYLMISPYYP